MRRTHLILYAATIPILSCLAGNQLFAAEDDEYISGFPKEWTGTYGEGTAKCDTKGGGDDFMWVSANSVEWSEQRCDLKNGRRNKYSPETIEVGFHCAGEGEESVSIELWHRVSLEDEITFVVRVDPSSNHISVHRKCE